MKQKQTVTKTITIVMDVDKDKLPELEGQWQAFVMREVDLKTVMKWCQKWIVETQLR